MQDQQLQRKFQQLDQNQKGYIDQNDLYFAFSSKSQEYPKVGCRLLIKLFSAENQLNFEQFVQLNSFIAKQMQLFQQFQTNNQMSRQQFPQSLIQMGFDLSNDTATSIILVTKQIFNNQTQNINLLEFQFVSSFLHLASQLFNEWNQGGDGILHIGPEKMLCLLMWFI